MTRMGSDQSHGRGTTKDTNEHEGRELKTQDRVHAKARRRGERIKAKTEIGHEKAKEAQSESTDPGIAGIALGRGLGIHSQIRKGMPADHQSRSKGNAPLSRGVGPAMLSPGE